MGIHTACPRFWLKVWWLVYRKVRYIIACPLLLFLIPPAILLALGPWTSLWVCRGAVIKNTPVGRPCKTPIQKSISLPIAGSGTVLPWFWIDTTINPRATSCATITLQSGKRRYMRRITQTIDALLSLLFTFWLWWTHIIAIDLFQDQ